MALAPATTPSVSPTDAELSDQVAAQLAVPREDPADSFVLHAPLELQLLIERVEGGRVERPLDLAKGVRGSFRQPARERLGFGHQRVVGHARPDEPPLGRLVGRKPVAQHGQRPRPCPA